MKFKDPATVVCPSCLAKSKHRVRELLALRANCSNCQASFADDGRRMRLMTDEAAMLGCLLELLYPIEKQLGVEMSDDELLEGSWQHQPLHRHDDWFKVKTLRDLSAAAERMLPESERSRSLAEELVASAASQLDPRSWPDARDSDLAARFDLPLLDALDPRRWERYGELSK